jgi:hypothetical protein
MHDERQLARRVVPRVQRERGWWWLAAALKVKGEEVTEAVVARRCLGTIEL